MEIKQTFRVFGSKTNLEMEVQNLGDSTPENKGSQNCLLSGGFTTSSRLMCGMKRAIYRLNIEIF